ncbi:hypothetical protein FB451DRAFT_766065 [Mycena latifolia]|nr:hypothetical protein FB451DRAFT_766065 [Mycena latifolia]
MTAAMAIWVLKFMEERAKHAKTSSSSSQVPLSPRIDFDQIELEKGIQASLESIPNTDLSDASGPDLSSLPVTRKSKNKAKGKARELSPDWDPPYAGEILAKSTTAVKPDLSTGTAIVKGESSGGGSDASALTKRKPERSSAKGSSFDVAKAAKGSLSGDVSTYMDKKPVPSASSSGGNVAGKPPLTMAQFLREKRGEPEPEGGDEPEKEPSPPVVSTDNPPVFLEDLETYKAYYDASVKCGVFDIDLQDEALREFYVGLPPLPPFRRIVPAYDRNRIAGDDTIDYSTGGRVQFSSWFKQLPRMLASNSMGAMLFTESEPNIINLSRVSPLRLSSQVSAGSSTTRQLHVDGRIAICVSAVCVTESYIVVPRKIGARSDRRRKTLSGVFHDQDWERFEAVVNLAFGETIMYGQMVDKSIAFQTMISPENKSSSIADAPVDRFNRSVPSSMFSTRSPGKHAAPSAASTPRVKTLLAYDDPVPVYDARKIAIDYQADLDRLSKVLPPFTGEIPSGSFAVVGYSCSTYAGTINSNTQKVPYVGLNILWVIVCGIPAH